MLTPKQQRFIEEYLIDLNATAAAQRAGYKNPEIGRQLITKNNVAGAIKNKIQERSQRTEIKQDQVVKELAEMAFKEIPKDFNAFAKLKALELLGKHLGMFTDKVKTENIGKIEVEWKE